MNAASAVWHPFTQHKLEPRLEKIVRAQGAQLYREDGCAVLDMISSWWVITHGHCHPRIMQAIRQASESLDQIIFADFSHEPAEKLADGLIELAPHGLCHVFYSDSGSTAVEVAIKMALGYFHHRGQPRSRIAVLEHSYHGDTIGTMSAGQRCVFNAAYGPLLFEVETLPFPEHGHEQKTLDRLEHLCRRGELAALLVEPLVLGAGGMKMYAPHVLKSMRELTARHGVLLAVDEVMTGWGRTGTLFACQQAQISPDILCTSKGLTGGALPLAATLCTPEIFDVHYSTDRSKTFFHSSSYTANPIACAAALANLQVWQDEPVIDRVTALCQMQSEKLRSFEDHKAIGYIRQTGIITAMELKSSDGGYLSEVGPTLRRFFKHHNVLLRPLGNVIYVMPPYCVTSSELDETYGIIRAGIEALTQAP